MAKDKVPATGAIRVLRTASVPFKPRAYSYQDHGGTSVAAGALGVDEHQVIKTLVFAADGEPLLMLMHGDCQVSLKALSRRLGAKKVAPMEGRAAERLTGYQVGGISPFGTRRPLPVYAEETIGSLERIYINGGKRGLLLEMDPADLDGLVSPTWVRAALGPSEA